MKIIALATLVAALTVSFLISLRSYGVGDEGDGFSVVSLPTPLKSRPIRVILFVTVSTFASLLLLFGLETEFSRVYASTVWLLLAATSTNSTNTTSYVDAIPYFYLTFSAVGLFLICLFIKGSPTRRLVVALLIALRLVAVVLSLSALIIAVLSRFDSSTATTTWITFSVTTFFSVTSLASTLQLSAQLPQPTKLRFEGRENIINFATTVLAVALSTVVAVVFFVNFARAINTTGALALFAPLFAIPTISTLILALLFLVAPHQRKGVHKGLKPPITVITPAYNEEEIISRCILSIDRAAARYGGRVVIIIGNDGSTDRTFEEVARAQAMCKSANVTYLKLPHRGKAAALNSALSRAETEIIVRIDADTVVDEKAFDPLPDWFANPSIGMVGALDLPRNDQRAWYTYGRLFECIRSFGFGRLAQQRVNGIICVPGTFTAFRRNAALSFGGFVDTMNGEDADLTIQFERLGYQVVVDPAIIIYEDVPQNWNEFRKQRIRWTRASAQLWVRHFTLRRGNFSSTMLFASRAILTKMQAVTHPILIIGVTSWLVISPAGTLLTAKAILLLIVSALPANLLLVALTIHYGHARKLIWLPVVIPFAVAKRLAALESTFTLPPRSPISINFKLQIKNNAYQNSKLEVAK